ncbi:MAG: TIGR00269 family protein [Candidatus Altiarchaeales archaeon]|nr:TIGR00269 family protein [Candidatus Altiarchaeales archaeon]MBD3416962.1 TIGR00269 family protein [Candidatus Altiarchaeales archaeon]
MRCHHCNGRGVFELRYSGHWLCEKHFIELFERRVKKTIRQNRLLDKEDRIMVGLSGGKDSMTCLKLLNDITSPIPHTSMLAVSIDEGIRGKNLSKASRYCKRIGVDHHVLSFKDSFGLSIDEVIGGIKADGIQACSVCGVLKRRVLNDYAREAGATKVATGHNLDDEIQTAFMNFVRGDLQRMARLGPEVGVSRHKPFTPRIKPLRECPEEEIRLYAKLMRLPHTRNPCPYSSSSYRTTAKKLIDDLEKRHPGSKYQMLRSTDELTVIMKGLERGKGPGTCERCGEPTSTKKCKTCILLDKLK